MKRPNIKKIVRQENGCSWFDSQNARLIVLCATLGIFGVHKFVQRKYFQGVLYVLLDLTVFGIILTLILSWLDLIFLTAKSDNRPGNMILGSLFIILESFIFVPGYDLVIKNINPESKDSLVVQGGDEAAEKIAVTPMVVTDNGEEIPAKITVNKDDIMLVVDSGDYVNVNTEEKKDDVVEEKEIFEVTIKEPEQKVAPEPVMWVEQPVKPSGAKDDAKPKKQKVQKQVKNDKASSDDKKQETEDDFGSFSLYGMIAGE